MTMQTTQDAPNTGGGFWHKLGDAVIDAGGAVVDYLLTDQPGTNFAYSPPAAQAQYGPPAPSAPGLGSTVMVFALAAVAGAVVFKLVK